MKCLSLIFKCSDSLPAGDWISNYVLQRFNWVYDVEWWGSVAIFWADCALYLNEQWKLIVSACGWSTRTLCQTFPRHWRTVLQWKPIGLYVIFSLSLFICLVITMYQLSSMNFTFIIVTSFFIIKPTRCTNLTNLFWPSWSCSKAVYKLVWHIPLLSVQWINSWWWTEELSETCRVSCQNKFVKLVHLVGFIVKKCQVWIFRWDIPFCSVINRIYIIVQSNTTFWVTAITR